MSKVSEPRNEVRPSAPRAGAQAGSNGPSGSPPLGSDRVSDRGHLSPRTDPSSWLTERAQRASDAIGNRTRQAWTLEDIQAVRNLHQHVQALTDLVASAVEERDHHVGATGAPVSDWHQQAREVLNG